MGDFFIFTLFTAVTMVFMTKLAIVLSKRWNFYDFPKDRNIHKAPTPLLGGMALILTMTLNMLLVSPWELNTFTIGLFGAIGIFVMGIIDDRLILSPFTKLFFQIALVSLLFFNGIKIEFITLPSGMSPLFFSDVTSFFVTQFWMLLIINMFNIIDGIDGLAVGISFLTAIVLFFVSLSVSPLIITYLLCAIIGSTGVFLKFNFFPARIFLGDSGSLLLGYLFGIISILGVLKSTISFLVLIFIFAIPLMDVLLSILRRIIKRKSIFYPDLDHMHHQLVKRGLSIRKTTLILYFISGVFGLIAILSSSNSNRFKIGIGIFLFVGVLVFFFLMQFSNKESIQ
ncbi:MAG: MraY family glycosyltransferase [Candidatus Margulisiibacteriota bacterium]